jgi:hypothetical protein
MCILHGYCKRRHDDCSAHGLTLKFVECLIPDIAYAFGRPVTFLEY